MANWQKTLASGRKLRSAIRNEDYKKVLYAIKDCWEEINKNTDYIDEDDLEEIVWDIENQLDNLDNHDEYDMTEEDVIEEIDYLLSKLYDFCDEFKIWIPIEESLDESSKKEVTDLTVECVNKRKIMEKLNSLNEAQMSPEDEKDTEILRNIVNKSIKRKNAKLTPEEQEVLKKYDLYRTDWDGSVSQKMIDDPSNPYPPVSNLINYNEYDKSGWGRNRKVSGFSNDKINLADRARKMRDRYGNYRRYSTVDRERAYDNEDIQQNYNQMKRDLWDRNYHKSHLSDTDKKIAELQAQIAKLEKTRDANDGYHKKGMDRAQSNIDKLLKRNESLEESRNTNKMNLKIKDYYIQEYPDDELGEELNDTATFKDMLNALKAEEDIYDLIGAGDSIIRERLFQKLAEIMNVEYDDVYTLWLYGAKRRMKQRMKSVYNRNKLIEASYYNNEQQKAYNDLYKWVFNNLSFDSCPYNLSEEDKANAESAMRVLVTDLTDIVCHVYPYNL